MGGRSGSSSGSTQQATQDSMDNLRGQATTNDEAMKLQGNLQTSVLNSMFPAFGEVVQGGLQMMNSNPGMKAFGHAMGMPIELEAPDFIQSFIDRYRPQEPVQPAQRTQPEPYDINEDMRRRMNPGQNMNPYGVNPSMNYGEQYGPGNQGQY